MSSQYEKIEATKPMLLSGTLLLAVWVALGTFSIALVNSLFGWIFLVFASFIVLAIIRRQLCNSCYYCKSCTKGLAKLSKLSLGGNHLPGIGKGTTITLATIMYVVLTVIPTLILMNSLSINVNVDKILLLAGILAITISTLVVRATNRYK